MPKRPELIGLGAQISRSVRTEVTHPIESFTTEADPNKILNIPIDSIVPNPDQPRKHFDEEPLTNLMESVREKGLLQPVVVRKAEEGKGFILIAGERRWRAAKAAGLRKIPVLVRQNDDPLELALVENLQRQDLRPLEEAEALLKLKERRGFTDEILARIVGKSRSTITELLTLNQLPESVKEECRTSDNYSKSILISIVRQPDVESQLALWRSVQSRNLSVHEARKVVKRQKRPGAKPYQFKYQPEGHPFTVCVTFRKSTVSDEEIKDALQQALKSIQK